MSGGADAGERATPTPVHAAGRLCLLVFLMAAYGLVKMCSQILLWRGGKKESQVNCN